MSQRIGETMDHADYDQLRVLLVQQRLESCGGDQSMAAREVPRRIGSCRDDSYQRERDDEPNADPQVSLITSPSLLLLARSARYCQALPRQNRHGTR